MLQFTVWYCNIVQNKAHACIMTYHFQIHCITVFIGRTCLFVRKLLSLLKPAWNGTETENKSLNASVIRPLHHTEWATKWIFAETTAHATAPLEFGDFCQTMTKHKILTSAFNDTSPPLYSVAKTAAGFPSYQLIGVNSIHLASQV